MITPLIRTIASLALLLLLFSSVVFGRIANDTEMRQVAQNWLTYMVSESGGWAGSNQPQITDVRDILVNDTLIANYYAISSGGYIIVPTLKELPPVKAYSEVSEIDDLYAPDGFAAMIREVLKARMDVYVEQFGSLEASQSATEILYGPENSEAWDRFAVTAKQFAESFAQSLDATLDGVGPLLTTTWHQGSPYNSLCPMGDGGRCVVGCVATAAAQIIYYHQWPPTGVGSHSYYWNGDNSCDGSTAGQTLSADFSDEYTYDGSNASVAEISYEMGVAFNMDYGYCGSGAYTLQGSTIFPQYFRYDNSAQSVYRSNNSAQGWFDIIKGQINQYHPTLYRISGHAIVCDGWRISGTTNQVHMNYGWGGSQNVWYAVDNLHCDWSGCDPMIEGMVINLIPLNGDPWLGKNVISDVSGGDGDGLPEAGETIEMVITVNNYGGGEVTDVNASLLIDDASITITDGSASLGTIQGRDSASNTADPFIFEIPSEYIARVDSFLVELTYNGTEVDTMVFEKTIGTARILLVDDDNGGGVEAYYQQTLDKFRSPYDTWIHSLYASPDSTYMSNYDLVIWFTGDMYYAPINNVEIDNIKGFLNNGGNLILSGQGIAAYLNTANQAFLEDYLKTQYLSTSYTPILTGSTGGQILNVGDTMVIFGSGGASNQTDPDHIQPINGSIGECNYYGITDFASVSYDGGDYKLAFFGFGCEAIRFDEFRFTNRDTVMDRMFSFFNYSKPAIAPQVSNLTIGPGDKMHLLEHTPQIGWDFSDPGGNSQAMYQIQVASNTDWATVDMWDSGPSSGSEPSITYSGAPLMDGTHYYLRIRAFNGTLWSGWIYSDMILNSLPAQPDLMSPIAMAPALTTTPNLTNATVTDPQNDDVTYAYEVYADAGLTSLVASATDIPQGSGTVSWQVSTELTEDNIYYWRVRADDEYETGTWSQAESFWVNGDNQLPAGFDLLTPEDASVLPSLTPQFTWQASSDFDPYDVITYTIMYAGNEEFTGAITVANLTDTSYTPTTPLTVGYTYYWKVIAHDLSSGQTASSSVFSAATYVQGDANGDNTVNVGDAVAIISFAFRGGVAPNPLLAGDANCDLAVNVGDAVYIISYVFRDGPPVNCN